jgi:Mucin-2 protein WxxW repeating region
MKFSKLLKIATFTASAVLSVNASAFTQDDFYYINGVPILKNNLWQCQPYSRTTVTGQASLSLITPHNAKKTYSETKSAFYTPPNYYVIESANRVQHSANMTYSATHSTYAEGQTFVSYQEVKDVQKRMNDYLVSLDIPDVIKANLSVKINELTDNYYSLSLQLASSHNVAQHTATVRGNGALVGKRSWYEGDLSVNVLCIPPEVKDAAVIERLIKIWLDSEASNNGGGSTGTWTAWDDRDNPSGNGDYEMKSSSGVGSACTNPLNIEARVVGTTTVYKPSDATPDVLSNFSKTDGLVCQNVAQADGVCSDYEVRYLCQ